jgi:hypothetical protein
MDHKRLRDRNDPVSIDFSMLHSARDERLARLAQSLPSRNFQFFNEDRSSVQKLHIPAEEGLFMHYTISEDRSGDRDSITNCILARLGSKRQKNPLETVEQPQAASSEDNSRPSLFFHHWTPPSSSSSGVLLSEQGSGPDHSVRHRPLPPLFGGRQPPMPRAESPPIRSNIAGPSLSHLDSPRSRINSFHYHTPGSSQQPLPDAYMRQFDPHSSFLRWYFATPESRSVMIYCTMAFTPSSDGTASVTAQGGLLKVPRLPKDTLRRNVTIYRKVKFYIIGRYGW